MAQTSLCGVNLCVAQDEITGIVGSTGSGKSTLLQHMNGLIRPQQGRVSVLGQDLGAENTDLRQIRQAVGLVFQRPGDQLFEQYVGDDIAYGPRMMNLSRAEVRERVEWAMDQVGLEFDTYRDRLTATLSGGERRRAGLASVLAMRPKVLLLDEPTAGLDPVMRMDLLDRLRRLHADGVTIVFVTHNMDDIALLAHRVYVLHEGTVTLSGTTRKVFGQRDRLLDIGLDVPTVTSIASQLRQRGLDLSSDILTMQEAEEAILCALQRDEARNERV
jgi:energy-coupling factor transport system ATP-binding protein